MSAEAADALTRLIIETFRLNGRLLAAGDALVADLGLSSARWQVLGAVALAAVPLPVAQIARNMGLTRQAVQRVVNELGREGLISLAPNPHHRRAKLVRLTASGWAAYEAALARQRPWAAALARGLGVKPLDGATALLKSVRERLDEESSSPQARQGDVAC
jgi:DNA-binding MarR family transcriptional regulator